MADLASFSLSDRRAAPHSRAHQYRLTAVSATWRGQTAGHAGGRGGRGGRGGERRGGEGEGRAGQGRGGEGRGRAGEGRAGQGRGGEGGEGRGGEGRVRGGEGRGLSTLSTNQNLCDRVSLPLQHWALVQQRPASPLVLYPLMLSINNNTGLYASWSLPSGVLRS